MEAALAHSWWRMVAGSQSLLDRDTLKAIYFADSERQVLAREVQEQGGVLASREKLQEFKTSDRLFVLGSGSSVNSLAPSQWDTIGAADSLGFNFFLVHDFIPTYYHMEFTRGNHDIVWRALNRKPAEFKKSPFIVNVRHRDASRPMREFRFGEFPMMSVPRRFYHVPADSLQSVLRYYNSVPDRESGEFMLHYRGSLTLMISIGVMLGYKEIVLVGIDLVDSQYFYEDRDRYPSDTAEEARMYLDKIRGDSTSTHLTADPNGFPGVPPIDWFLKLYNSVVLRPRGIKLTVASQGSLLRSFLDLAEI